MTAKRVQRVLAAFRGRPVPGGRRAAVEALEGRRLLSAVQIGDVGPANAPRPDTIVSDGSVAYYFGSDMVQGRSFGLWKTDGTAAGTSRLAVVPSDRWTPPSELTLVGRRLFFTAIDNDSYGAELYVYDLDAGALRTFNLAPGGNNYTSVRDLVEFNGLVYLTAPEGPNYVLYATDGTPENTRRVFDLGPGTGASRPDVARVGDELYFSAGGAGNTWTVYRSDGTAAGSRPLKTITGSAVARDFAKVGDKVVFQGLNVWVSDGTEAGTVPLGHPGGRGMYPAGDFAVFYGSNQSVWVTDGTEAGTRALPVFYATEAYTPFTTVVNGRVVVPGETAEGKGLYAVTPAGAEFLFKDDVWSFYKAGDRVYFKGRTSDATPSNLPAFTDGTYSGTWVHDVPPPPAGGTGRPFGFAKVAGGVVYDAEGLYFLPDGAPAFPGFSGHLFRDLDADGVYDPGEPRESKAQVSNLAVLEDGLFEARFAPPGSRTLTATPLEPHVRPTTPTRRDFTLVHGQRVSGLDFGFRRVNIARGNVWVDSDDDGFVSQFDPAAPGHTVFADLDRDGRFDAGEPSVVSGTDGAFELDDLPAGGVVLRLVPRDGWYAAAPVAPGIEVLTGEEGGVFGNNRFGVADEPPANYVTAGLFDDLDRDGVRDAGEGRRAGGVIWVDLDDDAVRDTGEPFAATPEARLRVPRPGTYTVRAEPPAGWVSTAPAPRVTLAPGQRVYGLELPVAVPAPQRTTLAGVAFHDADGDGTRGPGEEPRVSVKVYLDHDDDFAPDPDEPFILTDALGRFAFTGLAPGTYRVRQEIVDLSWGQTTPARGNAIVVAVSAGEQRTDLRLGARRPPVLRRIYASFFDDADADGVKDPDEGRPLPYPFVIYIDSNNDGRYVNGEPNLGTNAASSAYFSNLAPGRYRLRVLPPAGAGWAVSNLGPDDSFVVDVGGADANLEIGLYRPNIRVTDAWYQSFRLPQQARIRFSGMWPEAVQAVINSARVTREDGGAVAQYATQPDESAPEVAITFPEELPAGRYVLRIPGAALRGSAALPTPADYSFTFDVPPAPSTVVGRHVFYNRSAFDGFDGAADARDDAAVAPGKAALLPGRAAGAGNVTSYSRGINGVMIDVAGLPKGAFLDARDFAFRTGNTPDAARWAPLASQPQVSTRRGAGVGGSDRVTLTWPDNVIRNTWLELTMKATAKTGLASPDVFYFGNLIGDAGGRGPLVVEASDVAGARTRVGRALTPADLQYYDFNRDNAVNFLDVLAARRSLGQRLVTFGAGQALPAPIPAAAAGTFSRAAARRGAWEELSASAGG